MKCPMKMITSTTAKECEQEECAWWMDSTCAIVNGLKIAKMAMRSMKGTPKLP